VTGWRGIFVGMLTLVAIEAVVSRGEAAGRVGAALAGVGGLVEALLSPAVPLVPDLREQPKPAAGKPKPKPKSGAGGGLVDRVPDPLDLLEYLPHKIPVPNL